MTRRNRLHQWLLTMGVTSVLLMSLAFATAQAQGIDQQATPQRTNKVALELARLTMSKTAWFQILEAAIRQTVPAKAKRNEDAFVRIGVEAASEAMPYQFVIETSAAIWTKYFSDDELRDVLRFYRTATGLKMLKAEPQIMADSMAIVMHRMNERLPAIIKRILEREKRLKE